MKRLFLSVLLALSPLPAAAQCAGSDLRDALSEADRAEVAQAVAATPHAEGNHWLATKDGEEIHLIGTMHLGDPRMNAPLSRLTPLVEEAAILLLEMAKPEEQRLQQAIGSDPDLLLLSGTTLPEIMDEDDWQNLAEAAQARGIPGFMAAKFQPWYLSMLLATPPCAMETMKQNRGLDAALQDVALAADVPVRSLEPFDAAFKLFSAEPLDEQIEMLQSTSFDAQAAEDQFATLLASYFAEQTAEGWEVSRVLARNLSTLPPDETDAVFDEMEQSLLFARNENWIPVILAAAEETDGTVIAAFGAGHLPGEQGILALLEAEGFTLERQEF